MFSTNRLGLSAVASLLIAALTVVPADAGLLSGAVKAAAKAARAEIKQLSKKLAREVTEGILSRSSRKAAKALGPEAAEKALALGAKHGHSADQTLRLAMRAGKHAEQPEALAWVMLHGDAGAFFIRKLGGYQNITKAGLDRAGSDAVVKEAWRIVEGSGGSWKLLANKMTQAGLNSTERDFAEKLFKMRAEAGKFIPGMKKGDALISGQVGGSRTGIDYIKPNEDGTLSAIEFGTSIKPSNPREMTWDHLRHQLHKKLTNLTPDEKINLRGAGLDNTLLLQPDKLLDPAFPVHKFVRRDIYATRKNNTLLQALNQESGGVTFHLLY